jgi:hypothetical protein
VPRLGRSRRTADEQRNRARHGRRQAWAREPPAPSSSLGGEARCSGVVGGDLTAGDLTGGEKIAGQHWPDLDAADEWGPVDPWA